MGGGQVRQKPVLTPATFSRLAFVLIFARIAINLTILLISCRKPRDRAQTLTVFNLLFAATRLIDGEIGNGEQVQCAQFTLPCRRIQGSCPQYLKFAQISHAPRGYIQDACAHSFCRRLYMFRYTINLDRKNGICILLTRTEFFCLFQRSQFTKLTSALLSFSFLSKNVHLFVSLHRVIQS